MKVFAAIYIGSFEVSLKIFELSSKKPIREVDYIRARVDIGKDAYQKGYIGYELMDELGKLLSEYKKVMESYKVDDYMAYAGGVFRDIKNELFVLDQLQIRTGICIEVPSNSEHRFIGYKSVAFRSEFAEMIQQDTAVVDIGGGNLQVTLFSGGKVVTTQHMVLGATRIKEKLSGIKNTVSHYENQIEELVNKELEVFKSLYLKDLKVKNIIFMGEYIMELMKKVEKKRDKVISSEKFLKAIRKLYKKDAEQIARELDLPHDNDVLLIPYIVLYTRITEELNAEEIWVPGVNVSDGMAYDSGSGCFCRRRRSSMTAANTSAWRMGRNAPTASSWNRRLLACPIWSGRLWPAQCCTIRIRWMIMRSWRTGWMRRAT